MSDRAKRNQKNRPRPGPNKKKRVQIDDSNITTSQFIVDNNVVEFVIIPPDGGWGWFVVFASFISNFVTDGIIFTFGIFLKEIAEDMHTSQSTIAVASSILTAVYFLLGPIDCAIANRMGFRVIGVAGGILGACSLVGSSYVERPTVFMLTYGVLAGMAFSMSYIANILAVGFYFDHWRSLATSIAVTGSAIGTLTIPPVFNILLADYNWRFKFRIFAGLCVIQAFLGFVYKPIKPVEIYSDKKRYDDDKMSMASVSVNEENPKSIFYKNHNKGYMTNADLVSNASYSISNPGTLKKLGSETASFKSIKNIKHSATSFTSDRLLAEFSDSDRRPRCSKCCRCCKCRIVFCCLCEFCNRVHINRPMYRDDIMYTASVTNLPQYIRMREGGSNLSYHMSVTRVISLRDLQESTKCCVCYPESVKRTLATMMDFSLLKGCPFVLLALSGAFTYLGLYTPYTYILEFAISRGFPDEMSTLMLTGLGISNAFGRFLTGIMTFIPNVNALMITEIFLFIAGAATIAVVFFHEVYMMFVYTGIFGFFISSIASLRPIIAVEMLGLEKLTNSIGIIILFEGIACLIGVPVAGQLKELTHDYMASFIFAGSMIVFSVILLLPIKPMEHREKKRRERREQEERDRKLLDTRERLADINKMKNLNK
ncbi:PREDICTED: monocarboxylate transporter 7-like [Nicrophorus vespilloides]|uniref:Monocarboxylate transporter 7-like n=1 Tax=Nicrophorus vespilloides TaxID=110193 RepID=A0ABM1M2I4_NICVS|nr:PREDICTED: monocarboxylate transporter 7-like [Nicrophorus vespilloides]